MTAALAAAKRGGPPACRSILIKISEAVPQGMEDGTIFHFSFDIFHLSFPARATTTCLRRVLCERVL